MANSMLMLDNTKDKYKGSKHDKSKGDIFDDFICELFSSKLGTSMNLSLDKSNAKLLHLD